MKSNRQFDHEKLTVYQNSLQFVAWLSDLLELIPRTLAVHNQLDRASRSVPLNIAEGTAKTTPMDRCRFFDMARGSAVECAACLDVLVLKKKVQKEDIEEGKAILLSIVSMLVGLIKANDAGRFHEEAGLYGMGEE